MDFGFIIFVWKLTSIVLSIMTTPLEEVVKTEKYPDSIKLKTLEYIKRVNPACSYEALMDVACGTGQATHIFADTFQNIYGVDKNAEFIDKAKTLHPDFTFSVGTAENLEFANNSMDLITIASSLNMLDREKFYREVQRVLKPGGVLAAFSAIFALLQFDNDEATRLVRDQFLDEEITQGNHWPDTYYYSLRRYQDFTFPLHQFERLSLSHSVDNWSLDRLMKTLRTLDGYLTYLESHPNSTILDTIETRLYELYDGGNPVITFPVVLLLGTKPLES